MRLPRDLSGTELARALSRYGYEVTRQSGSHLRLTRQAGGASQHLTIPAHGSLRVGTLSGILRAVEAHLEKSREELARELFG